MTIHYLHEVRKSGVGVFLKLLFKWRGGITRLIMYEFGIFLIAFYIIKFIYKVILSKHAREEFEELMKASKTYQGNIPISIVLGFYIVAVYTAFIDRFKQIPWMMTVSTELSFYIHGEETRQNMYRNYIQRYLNLALIITIMRVHRHKVIVDMSTLVKRDLLTLKELEIINNTQFIQIQPFIPISWTMNLIRKARDEELITNVYGYAKLIEEVNYFRHCLLDMLISDQISFPLIYTQLNTLVVYVYFLLALFVSQPDYVPLLTIVEFVVYVGMLKCATGMLNPMGNNEENFEINEIIIYNWLASHYISTSAINQTPKLTKDIHYNTKVIVPGISTFNPSHAILNG